MALSCSPAQHACVVVGVVGSDCGFLWFVLPLEAGLACRFLMISVSVTCPSIFLPLLPPSLSLKVPWSSGQPLVCWGSLSPCTHSLVPSSLHLLPSVLRFITSSLNVKPCRYLLSSGSSLKQMHKCYWWGWECLTHLFSSCSYTSEAWEQSAELTALWISIW